MASAVVISSDHLRQSIAARYSRPQKLQELQGSSLPVQSVHYESRTAMKQTIQSSNGLTIEDLEAMGE